MDADWSLRLPASDAVYRAIILDACVRSGLYSLLVEGATDQDITHFDKRLLTALVPVLEAEGLVVRRDHVLRWRAEPHSSEALFIAQHLRTWLGLAERLSTALTDPEDFSDIVVLDRNTPEIVDWLTRAVSFRSEHRWLDVGAGTGLLGRHLASKVRQVIMCDRTDVASRWDFRKFPTNVVPLARDVLHDDIGTGYDGILLCRFVETLSSQDLQRLFEILHHALKPGGQVVLVGYFSPESPDYALFGLHVALSCSQGHLYTIPHLVSLAHGVGFVDAGFSHNDATGYDVLIIRRSEARSNAKIPKPYP